MNAPDPAPPSPKLTNRQTTARARVWRGVALVVLGCVAWAGGTLAQAPQADAEAASTALPVEVLAVATVDSYQVTRTYTGKLQARRSVELGFPRAGQLEAVQVREGQAVAEGATLARLDVRRLEADRARVGARLAQVRATLAEMRAGPRAQTIAASRARVAELEADLELGRLKLERRRRLLDQQVIAREEVDEARAMVDGQAARLERARSELEELEIGTRPEQIDAQVALEAQLEAELSALQIELDDSHLSAPFDAWIGPVRADRGAVLAAGTPVVRVVERGPLEAWVGVPPAVAAQVAAEAALTVRVGSRGYPACLCGRLPELDPATRTTTWVLELDATEEALAPEQVVRLELSERVDARGVWLPMGALAKGERDLWSCFVVGEGGRVERRQVDVLHTETSRVLVRGDLEQGERVVSSGVHRIVPGEQVRVVEASR